MKHFPGLGYATTNTDTTVVTITRVEGRPGPGPRAVPGGRREPPPDRDAVERDVPGVRRRERGRLVAGDRDGPAARRPGLHGRDDDRLARRHRPCPRRVVGVARAQGRAGRHRPDPAHRLPGDERRGLRRAVPGREEQDARAGRRCSPRTPASATSRPASEPRRSRSRRAPRYHGRLGRSTAPAPWDATDATDERPRRRRDPRPRRRARRPARSACGSSASARSPGPSASAVRADDRADGRLGRGRGRAGHGQLGRPRLLQRSRTSAAQLQCVWFRDERVRSAFQPQAGLRIVVHGRVDLFEPQGALQLYVESIQPAGLGDLTLRFEALKARLAAGGPVRHGPQAAAARPPATIAVITSPTGVVWRDIGHVLARRWPLTPGRPRRVPGPGRGRAREHRRGVPAPRALAASSSRATAAPTRRPQVTILARGGGSLEDLWSFNDERVVRAVVAHRAAGRVRRRPRGRRDAGRLRGRRPGADAVGRGGARRPGPGRAGWRRSGGPAERTGAAVGASLDATAPRARRGAPGPRPARPAGPARRRRASGSASSSTGSSGSRTGRWRPAGPAWTAAADAAPRPLVAAARGARGRRSTRRAAALAVLGPQATLERGYAIVRRAADGAIVRRPGGGARRHAPQRHASHGGDLPATADEPMTRPARSRSSRSPCWRSGSALVCSWPARWPAGPTRDDEEPDDD